jgi:hypothetical protein
VASDAFLPLINAQARARQVEPHVIVVKHPLGGLNQEELRPRIDEAYAALVAEIQK